MAGSRGVRLTSGLLLALLLGVGGCELQRDPTGIELERSLPGVYSVVVAGKTRVEVLVVRFSKDIPIQDAGIVPVADADVVVVRGGEETTLGVTDTEGCVGSRSIHLLQPGQGCYAGALPSPVRTGDRFELRVRFTGGEEVRGTAVVPGAPGVRAPAPGDTLRVAGDRVKRGSLSLELDSPVDGALLEVGVRTSREPFCGLSLRRPVGSRPAWVGSFSTGSVRIEPSEADQVEVDMTIHCSDGDGDAAPIAELGGRLHALAYDTAYSRWIRELAVDRQNLPVGRASAGLTGAVGYFAAANRATLPVEIRDGS